MVKAMRRCVVWAMAVCVLASMAAADDGGFSFRDTAGDHLDVLLDGKPVARYMYAHDTSTPARRLETYKPYLHVFAADGQTLITKGPGGLFPHHRGIFVGWNKIAFNGKRYDSWHMKPGDMVHQKFLAQQAGPDAASFTALIHWDDEKGQPIVAEQRTITVRRGPSPVRIMIDFTTKLTAPRGDITLDGDPEHAGVQFRPAAAVETKNTVYLFPKPDANPAKDLDLPWVGETFTLGGQPFSIVSLNPPTNPKHTRWSAYRDYGRFGCYFKQPIKSGESLAFGYRFLIADGPMPAAAQIQAAWDQFAGLTTPSPVPTTTLKHAASLNAPAKKAK